MPGAPGHEDYQRFVAELLEFLRFKGLPLPRSVRGGGDGEPAGPARNATGPERKSERLALRRDRAAAPPTSAPPSINLGDATTHLVLLNLHAEAMRAHLARQGEPTASSLPLPELAARFFEAYPTYPLMRLRLDPGEGLWFPDADVVYDGWTGATPDVDVVLTIRGEALEPALSRAGGARGGGH